MLLQTAWRAPSSCICQFVCLLIVTVLLTNSNHRGCEPWACCCSRHSRCSVTQAYQHDLLAVASQLPWGMIAGGGGAACCAGGAAA